MSVKAILFDSGRVLNHPATGHWFIPPRFFDCVDQAVYEALDRKRIGAAFRKAGRYLDAHILISNKDEELFHFREFYRIFGRQLPELGFTEEKIEFLASDLVLNTEKYVFYHDVREVLSALQGTYKLAVVSDAWPSLADVYEKSGLRDCFDSFVISSVLGTAKPNPKMYLTALEELDILPEEAVFVDDDLGNCLGAKKLGIRPILLCRNKWHYPIQKLRAFGKGCAVISGLEDLLMYLN